MRKHVPLLLLLAIVAMVRYRYLDTPLERDEGEFAYGAQRIMAGELPYVSFHAMKLPGIYLAYAAILTAFGETARGIHAGLLVANLASVALVYAIGRRLVGNGIVPATAFALFTLSPSVQGTQAQAEHFVVLWALAGMLLLVYDRWLFVAGLCFGMAMLTKQHGAMFGMAAMVCCGRRWPVVLAGWLTPLAVTCAAMYQLGAWEQFAFWTWTYPREYATGASGKVAVEHLRLALVEQSRWLWPTFGLAAVGLFTKSPAHKFVLLFLLAGCVAIAPGGLFRSHYFILLAPAVALAVGRAPRAPAGIALAVSAALLMWFYVPLDAAGVGRVLYAGSYFADSPAIAEYVRQESGGAMAVVASEPQLLFLSRRKSASPHIYMYPLMEDHPFAEAMQRELADDIARAKPSIIIYTSDQLSWLTRPDSPRFIFGWMDEYLRDYYYQVGRVESFSDTPSVITWGSDLTEKPPLTDRWLGIYHRKAGL